MITVISENKITLLGKTYIPEISDTLTCHDCMFNLTGYCCKIPCLIDERKDGNEVIWVEVQEDDYK